MPLERDLVPLGSARGRYKLWRCGAHARLALWQKWFVTQQYRCYCGVASGVFALNALGTGYFDQDNFFSATNAAVRSATEVFYHGMTLDQLGGLVGAHGVGAEVLRAEDWTLEAFRRHADTLLRQQGVQLLVNYYRPTLGQQGVGHVSPLAAYDRTSDRFLILDTATYRYPPVWVPAARLWRAMRAEDPESGRSRGLVVVSRNP